MKTWTAFIQINSEGRSIFSEYDFPIPEKLYQRIQAALKKEKSLFECSFYKDLCARAEKVGTLENFLDVDHCCVKPKHDEYDSRDEYLEALEEYENEVEAFLEDYYIVKIDVLDPVDEIRFKQKFIGKIYPEFEGGESYEFETETEGEPDCISYTLTVVFDEDSAIEDITDIEALGLESAEFGYCGEAYPDYEFLEEKLKEWLGVEEGELEEELKYPEDPSMKKWPIYIQANGPESSIFAQIKVSVPAEMFEKIQEAISKGIPLCDCDFYEELLDRAEERAGRYAGYNYSTESVVIDDPGDEVRFKNQFVEKTYPAFAGKSSVEFEAEEDWPAILRHSATVIFDDHGTIQDIIKIDSEGMESDGLKESSWGDAYPNYKLLAETMRQELGDENPAPKIFDEFMNEIK